jgi:hypothetical protein
VACVCAVHLGLWELRITRPAHTYVTTPIYPLPHAAGYGGEEGGVGTEKEDDG